MTLQINALFDDHLYTKIPRKRREILLAESDGNHFPGPLHNASDPIKIDNRLSDVCQLVLLWACWKLGRQPHLTAVL